MITHTIDSYWIPVSQVNWTTHYQDTAGPAHIDKQTDG